MIAETILKPTLNRQSAGQVGFFHFPDAPPSAFGEKITAENKQNER